MTFTMMVQEEKISVIVPVYNTEKYLEKCLRSIMGQTYRNLEIICVNDGSTDSSLEILNRLSAEDERIVVIDKENGGLGSARNRALEHVTSEWVAFVDSDDYIEPLTYKVASKAFEHNPGMVCFGIRVLTDSDIYVESDDEYYAVKYNGLVTLDDSMLSNIDVSACNKLYRMSVINRYNMHFPTTRYEDFPFTTQYMLSVENAFFIQDKLYNYIRHEGSIMSETFNGSPRASEHLDVYRFLVNNLKRNNRLAGHEELLTQSFLACFYFAVAHNTEEGIDTALELADKIHSKYRFLRKALEKVVENNTVIFYPRSPKKEDILKTIAQSIFKMDIEYFGRKPYKVVRLFNILLYKKAR